MPAPTGPSKKAIATPMLIITLGVGWLLTVQNVLPGVNWIWVLGLAVVGLMVIVLGGIDKVTMVVGPFLIFSTVLSLLRQTDRLTIDTEVPLLVIVAGVLLLMVQVLPIRSPDWLREPPQAPE